MCLKFVAGLGTKNIAKFYALWLLLKIVQENNIFQLNVPCVSTQNVMVKFFKHLHLFTLDYQIQINFSFDLHFYLFSYYQIKNINFYLF